MIKKKLTGFVLGITATLGGMIFFTLIFLLTQFIKV